MVKWLLCRCYNLLSTRGDEGTIVESGLVILLLSYVLRGGVSNCTSGGVIVQVRPHRTKMYKLTNNPRIELAEVSTFTGKSSNDVIRVCIICKTHENP